MAGPRRRHADIKDAIRKADNRVRRDQSIIGDIDRAGTDKNIIENLRSHGRRLPRAILI